MKKIIAAAIAAAALLLSPVASEAAERVKVGLLTCDVDPGIGYIIGSSKSVDCKFTRKGYKTQHYSGSIDKLGIDLGVTGGGKIAWLVFAASPSSIKKGTLSGTYVGASAEASLGLGLGGNWLIGGSRKSIALQPFSVTGTIGINWSWTLTRLNLD